MKVDSINNILGWVFGDKLQLEKRTTYIYDRGNNVTVVERKTIDVHLYDKKADMALPQIKGSTVDINI